MRFEHLKRGQQPLKSCYVYVANDAGQKKKYGLLFLWPFLDSIIIRKQYNHYLFGSGQTNLLKKKTRKAICQFFF